MIKKRSDIKSKDAIRRKFFTADWYPWFFEQMLESERVQKLSLAEEAAYRRALDKSWRKGSMPADPKEFADQVGKKCTVKIAMKVMQFFVKKRGANARLVNTTLEQVRRTQAEIFANYSRAGKKGAAKRWGHNELQDSDANSEAIPSADQSYSKEEKRKEKKRKEINSSSSSSFRSREKLFAQLKKDPKFKEINLESELELCTAWHTKRDRRVTERNFLSWLEKIEPVIAEPIPQAKAAGVRNGTGPRDFYAEREQRELEDRAKIDKIRREVEEEDRRKLSEKSRPDSR